MKIRILSLILLLTLAASLPIHVQANKAGLPNPQALVNVDLKSPGALEAFASTHLPMFSLLDRTLLAGADQAGQQALAKAGLSYQVLDPDPGTGTFYFAETRGVRIPPDYGAYGQVLLKVDNGTLLRMDPNRVENLTRAGVELRRISLTPKRLPPPQPSNIYTKVVDPDPIIQGMIDQVTTARIYQYDRELAGEIPVWVDGGWYTIPTRNTNSGVPIQKTTHYMGERLANDLGAGHVEYHMWSNTTNPNVIGEIPGLINPDDIYIIGAHVDDVNGTPGADDNASGSVATLLAADILSRYQWGCTLRFAFWTGEEQGLYGSAAYAQRSAGRGENILGYLNLDMIAYNTNGSPPGIDLLYNSSMPPTLAMAHLFADVVTAYNINLIPDIITSLGGGSDHSSFWDSGYTAILSIEDQSDFNPYYHGSGDTPAHTDPAYFTSFVKASIGSFAHLGGCLIRDGVGSLDGHVTAAQGAAPVAGADILLENSQGAVFTASTDANGYYTHTLPADTYTVTVSAYGYLPAEIGGVVVISNTITTQDFSLASAPTHTISGSATESGTGLPLLAEISFDGAPVTVWSDPNTGFYQAVLPENSYTMRVRSDLHRPQERAILLDHDQTQDFALEPLPCVLLVDDDQDTPDVRNYYTSALNGLNVDYDVWDISANGNPAMGDLEGYRKVLWYTGGPSYGTFTLSNETSVAAYLEQGGNFFLSSQEYLWEKGLTSFGQNYLHIQSFNNDVNQTTVTGQNEFSGLGPYSLSYPFTNYSDRVSPNAQARVAFTGNQGNAAISYAGEPYKSVFFGYPYEAISTAPGRMAVMDRLLSFFGSCQPDIGWLEGMVTDAVTAQPLAGAVIQANAYPVSSDTNGYYTMTLPVGTYAVTASLPGYVSQSKNKVILAGQTASLNFALQKTCAPIHQADFNWNPPSPMAGNLVSFTGSSDGGEPLDYAWNFGDGETGSGITTTHTFTDAGAYTITLTAANACSEMSVQHPITIAPSCEPVTQPTFVWEPDWPVNGEMITFTGSSSGSAPVTLAWDFGDGTTSSGSQVTHSYAQEGKYMVQLTASNTCSSVDIAYQLIIARGCAPVTTPDITWLPLDPIDGEPVSFTGFSEGSEPITYIWHFGDGLSGTGSSPTHTYVEPGTFTVKLSAINACGSAMVSKDLLILPLFQRFFFPMIFR